ncbi:MAG: PAS domain S-box protein [Ignavibacteriales bacterium]|nr:PAS domain S-box protein [Ignavibacteriales bacterium]
MPKSISVLHLEDNRGDAVLIAEILRKDFPDCIFRVVNSKDGFERALTEATFDLILSDYSLPSFTGIEALQLAHKRLPDVPFIFVSGAIGEDRAIESLRNGATDYVLKDRLTRLAPAVQRAIAELEERRQRLQSEYALRESEIMYKTLIETSPDAIVLTDLDMTMTMINRQMLDLYGGRTPGELLGRNAFELIAPEDHERARTNVAAALERGMIRNIEYTLLRKDGSRYHAELDASVIRDASGNPRALLAVVRDITERNRIREALLESETRYRSLVETSPDAVLLTDLDGVISFCNQRTADLLGFDSTRVLIGKSILDYVTPHHHDQMRHMATRVRAEERVRSYEYTLLTRSGARIQVDVNSSLFRDRDGKPRALTIFLHDITDRRRNEEKILEQAALLDIDPASISVCDLNDHIQFWNHGAEKLLGRLANEVLGTNSTSYLAPSMAEEYRKAKSILLETGKWRGELTRVRKDGSLVPVESQWTLVRDKEGRPKSVYIVEADITEKLRLQNQVLRAQRLESIGTLAGGIAHDLNNVLGPILLSLQVLRRKLTDEKDLRMLEMIEGSANRGAAMIKQVLTFARGIEGERIPLRLHHLINEVQNIAHQTFPKSMSFKTNLPKELWTVTGDTTQIHQVLLNLCVNARDAMPNGGTITVEAKNVMLDQAYAQMHRDAKPGAYVAITVTDTGAGIPPDLVDRIFEPFFTTKEQGRGTGLGLSTTLGIVKSHGGFINVYSEVNRGSRFMIYLPAEPHSETEAKKTKIDSIPRGNGELILVADDETTVLEITRAALEAHGYSVLTASDGTEAIAQAASHKSAIAVVICDMNMPYMSGPATIRALQKLDPMVKYIAVSGMIGGAGARDLEGIGPITTLQKPFTAEKLLQALHTLIERGA